MSFMSPEVLLAGLAILLWPLAAGLAALVVSCICFHRGRNVAGFVLFFLALLLGAWGLANLFW